MVPVQFHSSADMEWGANPQRAGHCNVEPLPGESSHWRKLRRRERAKKRSQDTFCVESPQGGICFAISAQNYGFARFFIYRPASTQFSKRAQAYVRAFIRQGRGAIPSRILSKTPATRDHPADRAQSLLAADSFFSFFCNAKKLSCLSAGKGRELFCICVIQASCQASTISPT